MLLLGMLGLLGLLASSREALGFGGHDRLEIGFLADGPTSSGRKGGEAPATGATTSGAAGAATDGSGLRRLLWELEKRTSIEVQPEAVPVHLGDAAELYRHPLLYWTGDRAFPMPSDEEIARLRRHLVMGGMLILDSAEGRAGGGFDQSVRALVARLFPNQTLARLPEEHVLYRSFYLLRVPAGRVIAQPYLEAVLVGAGSSSSSSSGDGTQPSPVAAGRAVIVYSQNDLGGAWARDRFGQWLHEVVPGGEIQREQAFRLGVNLVMYALCLDYKADQVHVPFIMRRRIWQAPLPKINLDSPPAGNQSP